MTDNTPEKDFGSLVEFRGGEATTTSLAIADGVGNSHKTVLQLVRQHAADLEEFGNLAFEMRNSTVGAGRPTEFAVLNEQQSTLLLTYMRNNEIVRAFKIALVRAFFRLRNQANVPQIDVRNHAQLTQIALQLVTVNEEQAKKIEEDRPKVSFHDQFLNSEGLYGLQNAARALHCRPNLFIGWLKREYLFYQGNALVPRIRYSQLGIFEIKSVIVDDKNRPRTYVTPKGLEYLTSRVPDHIRLQSAA